MHTRKKNKKLDGIIYILIWTKMYLEPYYIDMGMKAFENCTFKNCFITADHSYFKTILDFEVLIFNNVHFGNIEIVLPSIRFPKQIYCMYGVEPPAYHTVQEVYNNYFNITFTFKLTSNITIPYFVIKDEFNKVIGPKVNMQWMRMSEMNETSDYVKSKLQNKNKAAAWIVSHCSSPWRRFYALSLQKELSLYGHRLDIYGKCGNFSCPSGEMKDICFARIESDYYFFLAFENSFGEDYVTEKLLHALHHFSVPVVFGGANYSRFIPEGIYLDANKITPEEMAKTMNDIINNKTKYYEFFKWHDHYSFHATSDDGYKAQYCDFCAFLNRNINKTSVIGDVSEWWNGTQPPWPVFDVETEEPELKVNIYDSTSADGDEYQPQDSVERYITNLLSIFDPA